ncbi:hypothetical protein WAI453_000871 [Rhynchosporium graminicola]|uniref:Related to protein transport protein Sec39 n=1 Tax=Rhynchosporium graminicola TaxID=2792576 RepID=A0A1E1K549_9HELO|nr:related to protein transport protein Sec39 [Rhynchosporium commune]
MAEPDLSSAKAILLAVQLASKGQLTPLRSLISNHKRTLHKELVLRVLLSYLPETLDSSEYVPFLKYVDAGTWVEESNEPVDISSLEGLSDGDAKKKVRKLGLLPLLWPNAPEDAPTNPVVLFLIHRSLRIDLSTGLITQLPELLVPFLHLSDYLRTWMISTILPLLRLNEYHPDEGTVLTIPKFENLDDHAGVVLLLSKTGKNQPENTASDTTVGRDLRGLIGPWMYGDTRTKRRKIRKHSAFNLQNVEPLEEPSATNDKYHGWEEVFKWIADQAGTSWKTAVECIEQWNGPGDVDLGGYEDGTMWLHEDEQLHLKARYARSVLAAAYLVSEETEAALNGAQRILARIIKVMDQDRIPTLQAACALLTPVSDIEGSNLFSTKNAPYLRNHLLDDQNPFTAPKPESIHLLHALVISAFLCTRAKYPVSIRRAGELAIVQDEHEQRLAFNNLMHHAANAPKEDDKYWIRIRNEIIWLRGWGIEELSEGSDALKGRGIFGQLTKEFIEVEILKSLLSNTHYNLAQSIYEVAMDTVLSRDVLHDAILAAALNAYDNATNANRTRGGLKKCDEILHTFSETLQGSQEFEELQHLVQVTHEVGKYRLVFRQGEPFRPVNLRVHNDPISIIGKILDQNPRSYTKLGDFINMGHNMVLAGLTKEKAKSANAVPQAAQKAVAEKRIISMCIDAALAEEDFETAYSYVTTRLRDISGPAHARAPDLERNNKGLFAALPPKVLDDWSWRAALQAGRYERTSNTLKPTHLGNTSGNLDIRHLEQRMDCLSQALRLAPKATLQEILNVYRRCEEKLEQLVKEEAKIEAAWDEEGDDKLMPGGFAATPLKNNSTTSTSRTVEEAPLSLFDLSRASMARAQSGFSALSIVRGGNSTRQEKSIPDSLRGSAELSRVSTPDSAGLNAPMRKRDQLKNVAVGGLASGVGWLLGAPPVARTEDQNRD